MLCQPTSAPALSRSRRGPSWASCGRVGSWMGTHPCAQSCSWLSDGLRGQEAWSPHSPSRTGWNLASTFSGTKGSRSSLAATCSQEHAPPSRPHIGAWDSGWKGKDCLPIRQHVTRLVLPNPSASCHPHAHSPHPGGKLLSLSFEVTPCLARSSPLRRVPEKTEEEGNGEEGLASSLIYVRAHFPHASKCNKIIRF